MNVQKMSYLFGFVVLLLIGNAFAQNPIIQTIYTADPAPMVYNDTVYLYTGHDEDGSTYFTMKEWRCFSSTDMVNWTDLGSPLSVNSFSWAKSDAWAGQCIYRNGKFYYYVPMTQKSGGMAIGVAVSTNPAGPFTDALGHPLVSTGTGDIDPTVFIDDDGQAYLYWGNPNLWYVKLKEDMISYTGSPAKIPLDTTGFGVRSSNDRPTQYEEGPWFYKRNGLYYMVFAAGPVPEHISYSTSPGPTGPWTFRGVIMPTQGGSFTNHPGIIDYAGNSYFFYHNGALPGGGGYTRSVCVEQFSYKADGSIPTINMTTQGIVNAVGNLNPYKINEAETMSWESGIETEKDSLGRINITSIENNDYIKIRDVNFGDKGAGAFTASISSATIGGNIELHLNNPGGPLIGSVPVNYTGGWDNWRTETTSISGVSGLNDLYLVFKGSDKTNLFKFDSWKFEPKSETHDLIAINATIDNYKIDTTSGSNTAMLTVLAIYSDGTNEDITLKAEIIPQHDGIVNISNGTIKGISYNAVAIYISYQGKTDIVNMIVKDLKGETNAKTLSLDKYTVDMFPGSTSNVTVTVEYYDGHTEDVTDKAIYTNFNSSIASISAGKITAKSKGITIVTISFKGLSGDAVTTQLTINVSNRSPYNRNEAEDYNAQNGIQTESCSDSDGGIDVGFINNGDWLRYDSLDFGEGADSFETRVASATTGGNLEIRQDSITGTLVSTCAVTNTGGWQNWVTKSYSINGLSGVHTIYLKFVGGSDYLFNINWWRFKAKLTGIHEEGSSLKSRSFLLEQNYPNPFNPATTISFSVPAHSFVSLKVFDVLGKEVSILRSQELSAGTYIQQWDAAGLPSGIYFYRLQAGSFIETKKLTLLR